jgi:hypothetical protein
MESCNCPIVICKSLRYRAVGSGDAHGALNQRIAARKFAGNIEPAVTSLNGAPLPAAKTELACRKFMIPKSFGRVSRHQCNRSAGGLPVDPRRG